MAPGTRPSASLSPGRLCLFLSLGGQSICFPKTLLGSHLCDLCQAGMTVNQLGRVQGTRRGLVVGGTEGTGHASAVSGPQTRRTAKPVWGPVLNPGSKRHSALCLSPQFKRQNETQSSGCKRHVQDTGDSLRDDMGGYPGFSGAVMVRLLAHTEEVRGIVS